MLGDNDMKTMLADYMENGFLDNIIDMFRQDTSLFRHLGHMTSDERGRVRLGVAALIESLKEDHGQELIDSIPEIAKSLASPNPTIRADAAYILGIIAHRTALPYLRDALAAETETPVKDALAEAVAELS